MTNPEDTNPNRPPVEDETDEGQGE